MCVWGGWGGGAGIIDFLVYPNLTEKNFFFFGGGGGRGEARVSDFFKHRIQSKKKNIFFLGGGGGGGGRGRWTDRRTDPNQFAPSTSSKLGA